MITVAVYLIVSFLSVILGAFGGALWSYFTYVTPWYVVLLNWVPIIFALVIIGLIAYVVAKDYKARKAVTYPKLLIN